MRAVRCLIFFGIVSAASLAAVLLCAVIADAKAPAGTDPNSPLSQWFDGLKVPGSNGVSSCCGEADCRAVAYRIAGTHYEAFINGRNPKDDAIGFPAGPNKWLVVPDDVILRGKDNPTGRAQACWRVQNYDNGFLCFVLPSLV